MKPKPIFLVPAGLFLGLSFLMGTSPGGMLHFFLLGAAASLLPVGFSAGWPKYVGMALCLVFLVLAAMEAEKGRDWWRQRMIRMEELQKLREAAQINNVPEAPAKK